MNQVSHPSIQKFFWNAIFPPFKINLPLCVCVSMPYLFYAFEPLKVIDVITFLTLQNVVLMETHKLLLANYFENHDQVYAKFRVECPPPLRRQESIVHDMTQGLTTSNIYSYNIPKVSSRSDKCLTRLRILSCYCY